MNLKNKIIVAAVILVIFISTYWIWDMDRVLTEQSRWCITQREAYPTEMCGGVAERDIQKTYYLKIIALSVVVFGSILSTKILPNAIKIDS